jgi:alpha,alpha-trehalose phosphorylase
MRRQIDPWAHRETDWSEGFAAQSESLLALSNGYLGIRGTLDEGAPAAVPGTYLNGFFETRPIPYADRGYGDPEFDQVLIGVTDGTPIRLVVDGEPLDLRSGAVLEHERALDMCAGLLTRTLHWRSPGGHEVRVRSQRLVSLRHRELAVIEYEVQAIGKPLGVALHSELSTGARRARDPNDPRAGAALRPDTLVPRGSDCRGDRVVLVHETRHSRRMVAAGMDHVVHAAVPHETTSRADGSLARWSLTAAIEPQRPLRLVKLLAYHWAAAAPHASLVDEVHESLDRGVALGFEALAAEQRAALDEVWRHADIELDGDAEVQHALRYALFQLHQNAACADGHAIPAKGLTGPGYNGHTFWDTEIFLLPVLTYCAPDHAADALRWRASTLPEAQAKARRLGLRGAAFAWRTIDGAECSGYLPAGTAAFHVNADIAHAVVRHVEATGDARFEREVAAPLLVETARLWVSLGYHDQRRDGRFSIDGVTGPDEYSPLVDNNLYTNLMAQANLRAAVEVVERLGSDAAGVEPGEVSAWRRAADAMTVAYDAELGINLQDEDFARHAPFDFGAVPPEAYPLFLHVPYFELYRHQVVKQPDLVLALAMRGEAFTVEQKRRNFAYYEAVTVRDSSLSAGTQAVLAAEVGDVQLAYDYLAEAVLLDHHDLARNTADGLHLAALAGGWIAVIEGLAGLRQRDGRLSFAPRLPEGLQRIAFPATFRDRRLYVEITAATATYLLRSGAPLHIEHFGAPLVLTRGRADTRSIPPAPPPPMLRQPPGRAPRRRIPIDGHATGAQPRSAAR